MPSLNFLAKPAFHPRFKLRVHLLILVLICTIAGLSIPRLSLKNQPRTRASTVALGMSGKSLVLLTYLLSTTHIRACRRWHSYKAAAIISGLEVVFWGAVAFLVGQANFAKCVGVGCGLSWGVLGAAVVVGQLEVYATAIAVREFREHRALRNGGQVLEEEMVQGLTLNSTPFQGHQQSTGWNEQVVRGKA